MEIKLMEIPSFRILSMRTSVEKGKDLVAACACNDLLTLQKSASLERSGIPGLSGLSLLYGNWPALDPDDIVVEEGLILDQNIILRDKIASLVDVNISGFGLSISYTPGGLYAVTRVQGPYSKLGTAYRMILKDWLQENPFEYAGGPMLELYINAAESIDEVEILTDVCCPVTPHGGGGSWHSISVFRTLFA